MQNFPICMFCPSYSEKVIQHFPFWEVLSNGKPVVMSLGRWYSHWSAVTWSAEMAQMLEKTLQKEHFIPFLSALTHKHWGSRQLSRAWQNRWQSWLIKFCVISEYLPTCNYCHVLVSPIRRHYRLSPLFESHQMPLEHTRTGNRSQLRVRCREEECTPLIHLYKQRLTHCPLFCRLAQKWG